MDDALGFTIIYLDSIGATAVAGVIVVETSNGLLDRGRDCRMCGGAPIGAPDGSNCSSSSLGGSFKIRSSSTDIEILSSSILSLKSLNMYPVGSARCSFSLNILIFCNSYTG